MSPDATLQAPFHASAKPEHMNNRYDAATNGRSSGT